MLDLMFENLETWQSAIVITYGLVIIVVYLRHIMFTTEMVHTPMVSSDSPKLLGNDAPLVSIMVPVNNEESTIERCLESLQAQDYPNFEILVVDDRSDDATARIVERIAAEDERIQLVQVDELPEGWVGKSHALHVCQQHARGEWYLCVDADTEQYPSCLSVVMSDAMSNNSDVYSLIPSLETQSFWEGVVQPFAGTLFCLIRPLSRANNPNDIGGGFTNGQFVLFRKDAYRQIGGHRRVKSEFCEDVAIGQLARRENLRLRVVRGPEISIVRMYGSVAEIVRGWSRIFYSTTKAKARPLWLLILATVTFSVLSYVNLLLYGGLWMSGVQNRFVESMFWMAVIHETGQFTLYYRIYRGVGTRPAWYQVFRICGVLLMIYVLLKAIRMCRTHKVDWRGTTYDMPQQESSAIA